jgi:hypothetical protein
MVTPRLPSQARWEDRGQLAPGPNRRRPLRFHAVGDGAGSRESGAAHGGASPVDAAPWGLLTGSSAPAVPDPPAQRAGHCGGRASAAMCPSAPQRRGATRVCRASGAAGEAAPRPYTGRAVLSGAAQSGHGWAVQPRPVGVRRCLTSRPVRADPCRWGCVGRGAQKRDGGAACRAACSRASGAAGEAAPRPYTGRAVLSGAAQSGHGWAVQPRPVGVRRCLTRRWCAEGSERAGGRNGLVAARGLG